MEEIKGKDEEVLSMVEHSPVYQKTYVPGRGIERYNNSVKNLVPIRRQEKRKKNIAMDNTGLFPSLSMSWISSFMYKAHSKGLTIEELPRVSSHDSCDYNADRLEYLWKEELAKKGPEMASLSMVAWRFSRTRIFASVVVLVCSIISQIISSTFLMRKLLEYIQSGDESYGEGVKWASLLVVSESTRALCWCWSRTLNYRTGLRLRSACLTLIYRKIIRVDNLGNKSIGEVINVFTNDAQRLFDVVVFAPIIIEAPILTLYGIWYILRLLSPMALLGMIAFVVYFPVQLAVSRLTGYLQNKAVKISDMRVRLMNEILDCVKLIKMYAWEKRFSNDLLRIREKEQEAILRTTYCESLNQSIATIVPFISAIITFLAHVSVGNNLTAVQAFPYASFINARFRSSMFYFRSGMANIVSAGISLNRIKSLLLLEHGNCSISKPILESQAVTINHGMFACNSFGTLDSGNSHATDKERKNGVTSSKNQREQQKLNESRDNTEHVNILFDISFEAGKGKLVGICGQVGSGKSSLLLAALGQLRISEGQVRRNGSCAYVSQQAWITNATLRDNILFGEKFDHIRYHKVIHTCSLSQDIEMMPGGDQTEIGEKGVNLSGGQKQRVALARALYADRDIYFLDDPLSAVDSRVGSDLFDNLILGALKEKTVLFVTHQIQVCSTSHDMNKLFTRTAPLFRMVAPTWTFNQDSILLMDYLHRCDDIYMLHNGRIIEHGTHDALMKLGNEYALMVATISAESKNSAEEKTETVSDSAELIILPHKKKGSQVNGESVHKSNTTSVPLTVAETLKQGTVDARTYHAYIVAAGGYSFISIVMMAFFMNVSSTAFSSWWLALWIQAGGGNTTIIQNNVTIPSDHINDNPDFSYYQTVYVCTMVIMIVTSVLCGLVFARATMKASTKMHNDLFTKILASPMRFFDTTPSGRIQHLFSRDMDEVNTTLPVTSMNFMQTLSILPFIALSASLVFPWLAIPMCIIAAFYYFVSKIYRAAIRDLKRMENKTRAPVISFVTATVQGLSTIRAFRKEQDFMARFTNFLDENSKLLFIFSTSTYFPVLRFDAISVIVNVMTAFLIVAFKEHISPAYAGLAFAYVAQIAAIMPHAVGLMTELEARFISVERIQHYITSLKGETSTNQRTVELPSTWPAVPEIKFINVSMAYEAGAPFILKNISFSIFSGEKIGIVGRTGSGKSSLAVALFRLVELAEGKIVIDNLDISEISLSQLREKLSIIPQDPVLFSGTIRSNLDPFKSYTDAEIWKALEKTELKGRVESITGQLDASVGFGGDNLSVGERQLLCLARALLRNSKILVLDEATAAVDPETEIIVQDTVQREFTDCTILTIAHRLQTVLPLSRVLVMNDGEILEFDSPSKLLGDKSSEFFRMMEAAKQAETR